MGKKFMVIMGSILIITFSTKDKKGRKATPLSENF